MHFTRVITKNKIQYLGWIAGFKPEDNLLVLNMSPGMLHLRFDDLEEAFTIDTRCDEIHRARDYLKEGREHGWFKHEVPPMAWEADR